MNKQTEEYLKKIGVNAETIESLKEENEESPANVEDLSAAFKKNLVEVMSNDPDFIKPIKDEIRGTELSKIEHKIKKAFTLSADDVREKKFEEILETAINKIKSQGASTNEELQTELINLRKEVKRFEEEVIPAKDKEAFNKISDFKIQQKIRQILGSKQMIVAPEVIFPSVNSFLTDNYSVGIDGDAVNVKTKDGLNPLDTDGTKVLTLNDLIDGHLNGLNLIKQSNGTPANVNGSNGSATTKKPSTSEPIENKIQFARP